MAPRLSPRSPNPATGNDSFYSLKYIVLGFPMDKQFNTVVKNTVFILKGHCKVCARSSNTVLVLPPENKIHIFAPLCNILFMIKLDTNSPKITLKSDILKKNICKLRLKGSHDNQSIS